MKITNIGANGINLIKHFEGFYGNPYICPAGVPTIGYGTTFWLNGSKVTLKDTPITEAHASELLAKTLIQFEQYVDVYCVDSLNQHQFDALVSFCYNLGPVNLKSSTLLKKVNENPVDTSIRDEFMKWVYGGGKILPGLVTRREAEANLYFLPV